MGDDVAGLVIEGVLPDGARSARLAVEPARPGHKVRVFGYPGIPVRPDSSWVAATVRGATSNGRLQIDSSQESALRVQPGFSGSALYDDGSGRVVGLLAAAPPGVSAERDSYAITADRLRLAWPEILAGPWQRATSGTAAAARRDLTILHLSNLRFGGAQTNGLTGGPLAGRLHHDLTMLAKEAGIRPDILVVAGGLATQGLPSEFRQATTAIGTLAEAADIPRRHVVIVPGSGDVNRRASAAYFAEAEAEEREPVFPYWPKWKHFAAAFDDFYSGTGAVTFTPDEPWTLFEMPALHVVVAGINTTMADSHRNKAQYAMAGEQQLHWFAARLARYQQDGWLRLAALHHLPAPDAEASDLNRLLGRSGLLRLVLNGSGRPLGLDRLSSGLVTITPGEAVTGHYHLVTARRGGLTLHARQYETAQHRWIGDTRVSATGSDWRESVDWTGADAALPPTPATASNAEFAGKPPLQRAQLRVVNEFLDRVAEATQIRFPEATVTLRPEENYLRITRPRPGGAVEQWPIGVIDGPATGTALDAFATRIHARFASADPGLRSELVYTAPPAPADLLAQAQQRGIRLRSLLEYQGLLDLSQLVLAQRERLDADPQYQPRLYVRQRYRVVSGNRDAGVQDDLVAHAVEWVRAEGTRLMVALGDFGRGKTTFLRQLTRVLQADERPGITPVLVELRHLEKAPRLDELLLQHLVRQELTGDFSTARLNYMITSGRIALLLDGFDELELRVGYDHAAGHLQKLLGSAGGQSKVILTSRTQHFRSTEEVRNVLGQRVEDRAGSRMVVLEEFSNGQIVEYLAKLHPDDPDRARTRFELISGIANLLDLAHNPRILTFIADLDEDRLHTAARNEAGNTTTITAASLYREIIDRWLSREVERLTHEHGLPPFTKEERRDACTALALRLWISRLPQLALTDLSAEVTLVLRDIAQRGYTDAQAVHSIASGSLLVREESGGFAFIHQSIMEWLVASAAARALGDAAGEQRILATQQMSQLTAEFFIDLAGKHKALLWTTTTLANPAAPYIAKQNALVIAGRVGMKPGTQLAGVDLRGQDLSLTDLRGANLSGANLAGMTLDGKDLIGANLSSANLSGARMVKGSLRGARLTGSRWDRAVILGTEGVPPLATAPEIRTAAVARRDPVELVLSQPGAVTSVAFSPVSPLLAIGRGRHVELVDADTGKTLRLLGGNIGQVNDVAFSPDGSLTAAASADKTAWVWETDTGVHRSTLIGHEEQVGAVAFSPDGSLIATASDDSTARTWDTLTGRHLTTFNGHDDWVRSVAFSPDGSLIATASRDGTARTWDSATGTRRVTFRGHKDWVRRVTFSPDGSLLATASRDSNGRLWDVASGGRRTVLDDHITGLNSITFSPDGSLIVTAAGDNTARVWDTATTTTTCILKGHKDWVRDVAFSFDGTLLATASRDDSVLIWDTATWTRRATLSVASRAPVSDVAFSPDGSRVATASDDGTARIWSVAKGGGPVARPLTRHTGPTTAVAFSPDGTLVATASEDRTARLWDAASGRHLTVLKGHSGAVRDIKFSPDGTLVATASGDCTARLWDTATGRLRDTLPGHSGQVNAVAFAPDGRLLATASEDTTARIWDLTEGRQRAAFFRWAPPVRSTLSHGLEVVTAIAFSPDGSLIATGLGDSTARIWETVDRTVVRRLTQHSAPVTAVMFAPDNSLLATASADCTVRLWPLGRTRRTTSAIVLSGHTDRVTAIAFSPDGSLIATASADATTRVWHTSSGRLLGRLIALPHGGSALLLIDDRYRVDDPADDLWWVIKLCRFGPGELDPYVPRMRQIADGEWIFP